MNDKTKTSCGSENFEQSIELKKSGESREWKTGLKFILYSFIGIYMFFAEISIKGVKAIPIQHIVNFINDILNPVIPYYALIFIIMGALIPIRNKTYKTSLFNLVFTVLKGMGAILGIMAVLKIGPALLLGKDYLPFLFNDLVVPITILIPASGLGFVFLMNFGLPEFLGALMQKIMRIIFKTPGESAVDAIVSFTGGYTMAMLVTNSFYKKGIYTARESAIIATGFSTVAVSFLMIIAKVLGLTEYWNLYFATCLFVTFAVTAVTARIYPISKIPNTYYDKPAHSQAASSVSIFSQAWDAGINASKKAKPLSFYFKEYFFKDSFYMVCSVASSILSVGLIGILLANMTPLFDIIGYVFYPFTILAGVPSPFVAAKASAMEIAEMFLPAMMVVKEQLVTKFVVAVTSVSAILFFSASIPSLLATDIPVKMRDIILIWIERTILSILLSAAIAHLFL